MKILTDLSKSRNEKAVLRVFFPLFCFFISDVSDGQCKQKLFADDTLSFTILYSVKYSVELNNYLTKIAKWYFQRNMNFNLDIYEQVHKVMFSSKGL